MLPVLSVGGVGAGAPMHHHDPAWNVLLFGRKRWFMVERKPLEMNPTQRPAASTLHWIHNDTSALGYRALQRRGDIRSFVQHPGDLVYIPRVYGHSTINLEASVAVATQFKRELALAYAARVGNSALLRYTKSVSLDAARPPAGPAWAHIPR